MIDRMMVEMLLAKFSDQLKIAEKKIEWLKDNYVRKPTSKEVFDSHSWNEKSDSDIFNHAYEFAYPASPLLPAGSKPWGWSCQIDLSGCFAPYINNQGPIHDFVVLLCELIGMKRHGECHIQRFGTGNKEGFSFFQLIETSNISGHFSSETLRAYIDIFSCKEYDMQTAARFCKYYFKATSCLLQHQERK